ncbi:MAG: cyclic nucleotide-binding domain-containing protein [Nannocystaceae bacterium]
MPLVSRVNMRVDAVVGAPHWSDHALFAGMEPQQIEALAEHMDERIYNDGEVVVREGEAADALYVIEQGILAVVRDDDDGQRHELKRMHDGELFGEMGLFREQVRTATVVAVGRSRLLRLPFHALGQGGVEESLLARFPSRLMRNIGALLTERMATLSDDTVELLRDRLKMGQFFVSLVCLLSLYTLGISIANHFAAGLAGYSPLLSIVMLAVIAATCTIQIRQMGWTLDRFGVTLRGARRALGEATAATLLVLGLLTLGKWLLIQFHPAFADVPLIGFAARVEMYGADRLAILGLSYGLFSPIQEFIARGVLQTSLEQFLTFKRKTLAAVLLSNLLFATLHLHTSYRLAALAFAGGLLWGWMYARQRTLVGVSVSHILVGLYLIYVLSARPL